MDLLGLRIDRAPFLVPLYATASVAFLFLLIRRLRFTGLGRRLLVVLLGGLAGLLLTWLTSDILDVFGLPLTLITRMWVVLVCAGLALAVMNLVKTRWWRRVVAIAAVPLFIITGAAGINVDFGAYRNLNDALGVVPYQALPNEYLTGRAGAFDPSLSRSWRAPADMPTAGVVGTVTIPATTSGFNARTASIYLPPAALVANAPVLPVVVVFSGQPGAPSDMFTSARIPTILDAFAAAHRGLAPIVVVADQLGLPEQNPMCVDSPLGNSATYLTVDVPQWIRTHLTVSDDPRYWAVAGFSQGGTCAIQFGAGHPELYRSIVDISGELMPTIGANTIQQAFGGSTAAYDAVKPITLLAANAPYQDSWALFGVGQNDAKYQPIERTMMTAAAAAGMSTEFVESPNSAHDWNTVRFVMKRALPLLATRLGLAG